jgi:hypothetical protein
MGLLATYARHAWLDNVVHALNLVPAVRSSPQLAIHIRLDALLEFIGPVSAGFVFVGVVRARNRRCRCLGFSWGLSRAGFQLECYARWWEVR